MRVRRRARLTACRSCHAGGRSERQRTDGAARVGEQGWSRGSPREPSSLPHDHDHADDSPRRPRALADALLTGADLTEAQRSDLAGIRELEVEDRDVYQPQLLAAVDAMRRARARGDAATVQAIMAMIQNRMESERTWR